MPADFWTTLILVAETAAGPQALPEWMAGGWATTTEASGEWTEEWWTPPKGGIMLGAGRTGKAEALGFFEHMRIVRQANGLAFCAMPQGQSPTCFQAVSSGPNFITFENPAHDFPKRVTYRREGDELIGAISDLSGERLRQWRYRRMGN